MSAYEVTTESPLRGTSVSQLTQYFPSQEPDKVKQYSDEEIKEISEILRGQGAETWSRVPRLYIVFRRIGYLQHLDTLVDQDITDIWFPFSSASLARLLRTAPAATRRDFLASQDVVITTAIKMEKDPDGELKHHYFKDAADFPFQVVSTLGRGATGVIHKVVSPVSPYREYARKQFRKSQGIDRVERQSFMNEVTALRKLDHQHCVRLAMTYSDPEFFGILMDPVADCNLRDYCDLIADHTSSFDTLRTFFGCLSSALTYLHSRSIRHRDVKPENILVKGSNVYLTDFGISLDWENLSRCTTTADAGRTPLYCAPEVAEYGQKRNESSDIWSLGCVFLEMSTVLKFKSIAEMRQHFMDSSGSRMFYQNVRAIGTWIKTISNIGEVIDNVTLDWSRRMLMADQKARPQARKLLEQAAGYRLDNQRAFCCADCGSIADVEVVDLDIASAQYFRTESSNDTSSTSQSTTPMYATQSYGSSDTGYPLLTSDYGETPDRGLLDRRARSTDVSTNPLFYDYKHLEEIQYQSPGAVRPRFKIEDWQSPHQFFAAVRQHRQLVKWILHFCPGFQDASILSDKKQVNLVMMGLINNGLDIGSRIDNSGVRGTPIRQVVSWSHKDDYHPLFMHMVERSRLEDESADQRDGSVWFAAACQGSSWAVIDLVTCDIPKPAQWQCQMMQGAISGRQMEIVEYLQAQHVWEPSSKCDHCGFTMLSAAVTARWTPLVEKIFESDIPRSHLSNVWAGDHPLFFACRWDLAKIVSMLLRNGANPSAKPPWNGQDVEQPASTPLYDTPRELKPKYNNFQPTPLYLACKYGCAGAAQSLLATDIGLQTINTRIEDYNEKRTPLIAACHYGHPMLVQLLLEYGATVNRTGLRDCKKLPTDIIISYIHITPIWTACREGNTAAAEIILRHDPRGLNAHCGEEGTRGRLTPLGVACMNGHWETAALLLSHGAFIKCKNGLGMTPLHIAAQQGCHEVVQVLLAHGADPQHRTGFFGASSYLSALELAKGKGHEEIVQIMTLAAQGKKKSKTWSFSRSKVVTM